MADYLRGGEMTTVTATMTELFPALWFNKKNQKITKSQHPITRQ